MKEILVNRFQVKNHRVVPMSYKMKVRRLRNKEMNKIRFVNKNMVQKRKSKSSNKDNNNKKEI